MAWAAPGRTASPKSTIGVEGPKGPMQLRDLRCDHRRHNEICRSGRSLHTGPERDQPLSRGLSLRHFGAWQQADPGERPARYSRYRARLVRRSGIYRHRRRLFWPGAIDGAASLSGDSQSQQACYDMLMASRAILDQMKIAASKLCLAEWSQRGFVTMAFLKSLENAGIPVAGTATASAPPR